MKRTVTHSQTITADEGPITLGDLKWLVERADKMGLTDEARVQVGNVKAGSVPSLTVAESTEE